MKRQLQREIEEVFTRLSGRPPTAEEQAIMMSDALSATMAGNPVMRVTKIDERFIQITGADNIPKTLSGYIGRAGEVVIYDSVTNFIKSGRLVEKWGSTAIDITADVLIPIDIRSSEALERSSISTIQKQSVEVARNTWLSNVDKQSIADFVMTNAFPIESKARWETKVYVSESGTKEQVRPADEKKVFAKNTYLEKIAKQGGKTVVGAVLFDVIFEDVFREQTNKLTKALVKAQKESIAKTSVVEIKSRGAETAFFKLVSLRINAFVPTVVDDKNFKDWLKGQVIDPADKKVNMVVSEFTTEVMDNLLQSYKKRKR